MTNDEVFHCLEFCLNRKKKGKKKYYSDNETDKSKVVQIHAMKAYSRSRYTTPLILQLSIR
jgi:hypothetical protein